MKLRFLSSVLIFISAYSPLSVIFLIQDFDCVTQRLVHPVLVLSIFAASIISIVVLWIAIKVISTSTPVIKIKSVSNRSGELINYSIPYMISFFVMDLGDGKVLCSFAFFMVLMFFLTLRTHNIFINPILACMGYNLYDVIYTEFEGEKRGEQESQKGIEHQSFFLVKGKRLTENEICRIVEISEQLFVVTVRDPEV